MIVVGMMLDLFQMGLERIFRRPLQIDVNSGVYAIAFVDCAVPSHSCDHLLTNIIDCVSLALSVLPASDHDLLRPGSGALIVADKAEIAHTVERVIAYLARIVAIVPWRQSVRTLDQTRQCGAFSQRHFTRRLAEVPARRCFGPV